jgi:hypothetical protein
LYGSGGRRRTNLSIAGLGHPLEPRGQPRAPVLGRHGTRSEITHMALELREPDLCGGRPLPGSRHLALNPAASSSLDAEGLGRGLERGAQRPGVTAETLRLCEVPLLARSIRAGAGGCVRPLPRPSSWSRDCCFDPVVIIHSGDRVGAWLPARLPNWLPGENFFGNS